MQVEQQDTRPARRIFFTPQGRPLDQELVEELAEEERLLLIAGHYEGVDERVVDALNRWRSASEYVLTGGELPAMVVIDAVTRLQDGVLDHELGRGGFRSVRDEDEYRLLDSPHYTRPRTWRDRSVPEVLLGGDHPGRRGLAPRSDETTNPYPTSGSAGATRRLTPAPG